VFLIASPFGESAATYFPANGDLWFTWLMVAWGGDRLARVGQVPFLLAATMAVYQMVRSLQVSKSSALVACAWFVGLVPLLLWSFEAIVDTIVAAGYLCACAFLLEFARRRVGVGALVVAGLSAGLAMGSKMTSAVFVFPLLALGMVAILRSQARNRVRLLHGLVFLACTIIACGFWWIRNTALTGNPLYPAHIVAFGRVWLRGWYGPEAMSKSPFYIPREWWGTFVDILVSFVDFRLAPIWLAALFGVWSIGKKPAENDRWVWLISAGALINVLLFWVVIPYRTQQRFMLHAFGLATVPLASLFQRSQILRWVGVALLAIHLVTPSTWPFSMKGDHAPWSLTGKIPTAIPPLVRVPLNLPDWTATLGSIQRTTWLCTQLALAVAGLAMAWSIGLLVARPSRARLLICGLVCVVVWIAGAAWFHWGVGGAREKYPMFEYYSAWLVLESKSAQRGIRVAYSGTNLPYYLMGSGLRNSVEYVNVKEHTDWQMHDYHRAAAERGDRIVWDTPRPGWDRLDPDFDSWLANLRARRIEYLVVARARPEDGDFNRADREGFPIERTWADEHPESFQPVYGVDPADRRIRIYRLTTKK
jgi:hypothetical protein